ncbi:MAG TPA: ATP-binding cassette domain-containing protein [Bacilli bacterium]
MILLDHVNLIREETNILNDVTLDMKAGEHWVILGKNGSGKTTLLEMVNGYMFPSSGKVTVLDQLFGTCDVREVRKRIGYISQSLFEKLSLSDPVLEVVATGEYAYLRFYETIPQEVLEKAANLLEKIQLGGLKNHLLGTLSQGERKKVMLARALMLNPEILVLDEPCSGLDLYEREKLLTTIHGLGQEQIQMIYVTHHIEEIIPLFTHVALIDKGRIVAAGEKKTVLTADLLQNIFQVPLVVEWFNERPWIKVLNEV